MKTIFFLLAFCYVAGSSNCFADDLAGGELAGVLNETVFLDGTRDDIAAEAKAQFYALKRRGTVWLRTQVAMDELLIRQSSGKRAEVEKLAAGILRDCRLINNQMSLERARYLLATLKSSDAKKSSFDAITAMIAAADGEAALALAEDALKELAVRSDSVR